MKTCVSVWYVKMTFCMSVRGDWLLGYLYRSSAAQLSVAGLQPINIQDRRIINVDLSSVVSQLKFELR